MSHLHQETMRIPTLVRFVATLIAFYCVAATSPIEASSPEDGAQLRRGLQTSTSTVCKVDTDCKPDCTKKPCQPILCMNSKCRNPIQYEKCGNNICDKWQGQGCCDSKCGACGYYYTTKDKTKKLACPKMTDTCRIIPPTTPKNSTTTGKWQACGKNTCNMETEFCCNASCGKCAPLNGRGCTKEFCL